ncbi:GTPase-activating protein gyp7 [Stemphylium lycopersici]|uniref:GTPase-activating protein gyp7 n=1 Tax=Stemphylium lycopersici TaxID=183478 RepID=A0A364NG78_STELY|nr:GTPase-activating protein gyp7 [Stemphylium lycopersici]RAR16289.1 GTPase-activating protein gyp7 [Stemphylium lycopersici]
MGTREMTQQTDQAYGHEAGQSHYDYRAGKGQQEQSEVAAWHSHSWIQHSQWIASWIGEYWQHDTVRRGKGELPVVAVVASVAVVVVAAAAAAAAVVLGDAGRCFPATQCLNPVTRRMLMAKAAMQAAANFERVCDAANARFASYFSLTARSPLQTARVLGSGRRAHWQTGCGVASGPGNIMNRWLNRKKDGGEDAATAKKTKKGKKGQEEPKPEFDLNAVLPKADDFRTSLIMPGLSTRFSMLREQDDPLSLMGKASDDSVLQPKRQSRLHEFGFVPGGLSDIAEISSLRGSVRPPFAAERTNSFDSSRDDDGSGSIMTRARPGEGNVLFGGRQKIYMISNTNAKGTGRTLYDDDVNMSAYQRLRQEEKERLRQQADEEEGQHSEPSSPTALSRKRETSSSTNSGTMNTRASTAATSIASQGANSVPASSPAFPPSSAPMGSPDLGRSTTKRRLYDQALDQQIQEQQSSAINRLNSIQRARAPTGRSTPPVPMAQARSATNLNDRFARGPTFRSDSPNALAHPGMSRNNSGASSPVIAPPQSPSMASPVASDSEEAHTLNAALQPNDRGKATAMGAFNKPREAFSEEQYAERLRQMKQEREVQASSAAKVERSPPRKPTLRERAESQRRKRAESDANQRQRSESPVEPSPAATAFSKFQAAASQMSTAGPAAPSSPPTQIVPEIPAKQVESQDDCNVGTFFTSADSSEGEEEDIAQPTPARPTGPARRFENLPVATGPAPPMFEHPALRSRAPSEEDNQQPGPAYYSPNPPHDLSPKLNGVDVDSPTLPEGSGLSGLIRQHLRNGSALSSNYGEPGPPVMSPPMGLAIQTNEFGLQRRQPGSESVTPVPSTYSHSNPWDLDDIDNPYREERGSTNSASPIEGSMRLRPLIMSGAPEPHNGPSPWDLTPRRNHERIASNETEAEHEAFQRDLAYRQRLIQENLRARAEGRSTSPGPGAGPGPSGGLKTALNMLRAKSSRESFATVDVSNKSVRKLALGATSTNASSTSLAAMQGPEVPPLRPKPSRVLQQSEQDAQRELEYRQRSATDSSRTGRPAGRSPPVSTRSSTRERSSSGTSSGRSHSRGEPYRDDLEQAMTEGSRGAYPANTLPSLPGYVAHPTPPLPAERPSLESQGRMSSRSRSNSKAAASNYFDSNHLHPIQTNIGPGQHSRHAPPQDKLSPGLPISPRPSPGAFSNHSGQGQSHPSSPMPPFPATHTPPISNPTTPSAPAFNPSTVQPLHRQGVLRKRSIAKSDISEPVFLSTTSVIDTVNLPAGASLKNGSEPDAPPVPPINPMRRRFGFGRNDGRDGQSPTASDPAVQPGMDIPRAPYAEPLRTGSADGLKEQNPPPRNRLRKATSEGRSLRGRTPSQLGPSPALPQNGFPGRNNSPPGPTNDQSRAQQPVEGAMF